MLSLTTKQVEQAKIKAERRVRRDFQMLYGLESEQEHSALLAITYMAEELIKNAH